VHTSRGFFPWRLSDTGPQTQPHRRHGPASETLHNSGCEQPQQSNPLFNHLVGKVWRASSRSSTMNDGITPGP
jgi:hypothetical protein